MLEAIIMLEAQVEVEEAPGRQKCYSMTWGYIYLYF